MSESHFDKTSVPATPAASSVALRKLLQLVARRVVEGLKKSQTPLSGTEAEENAGVEDVNDEGG